MRETIERTVDGALLGTDAHSGDGAGHTLPRVGVERLEAMRRVLLVVGFVIFGVTALRALPSETGTASPGAPGGVATSAFATPTRCTTAGEVAAWPLSRQAAQVLMLSVRADAVATAESAALSGIGGMLLSGSTAPPGLARAVGDLHAAGGTVPPLVAVDEEGGRVQRIGGVAPPLASARQQAASLTVAQVEDQAAVVARRLHDAGVDMDFAPDADIDGGSPLRPIGDRSFSGDPDIAAHYAVAFARGLRRGGLIPVAKHFPGHGRADGDTEVTPATTPGIDALRVGDLRPFEALIADGVPAIMLGHLTVPGLTEPGRPASLSSAANALLRRDLHFDGLVVTDSLSMGAISRSGFSVAQATVAALRAGSDLVVFTSNEDAPGAIAAIGASVNSGSLSAARLQDAVTRVLALKHIDLCARTR